ncbi:hypothetical protein BG006_002393, partial [Podila minutissima]
THIPMLPAEEYQDDDALNHCSVPFISYLPPDESDDSDGSNDSESGNNDGDSGDAE